MSCTMNEQECAFKNEAEGSPFVCVTSMKMKGQSGAANNARER